MPTISNTFCCHRGSQKPRLSPEHPVYLPCVASVPNNAVPSLLSEPGPCAPPATTGHPCPRQPMSSQQSSIPCLPETALSPPSRQTLSFVAPQGVARDQEQSPAFPDLSPLWVGGQESGQHVQGAGGHWMNKEELPHSCVTWGRTGPRSPTGRRAGWARPLWRQETWTAGWTRARWSPRALHRLSHLWGARVALSLPAARPSSPLGWGGRVGHGDRSLGELPGLPGCRGSLLSE